MDALGAAWQYALANRDQLIGAVVVQVELSLFALLTGVALCVPLGILATRNRLVSLATINLFGTARAIPSIAILFLAIPFLGFGFTPSLVALAVLACPPILVNTNAGFMGVAPPVVEAARGMGMNPWQVLLRVELPLALPVVLAGVRTAALEVIASATLATFIAGGGLGDIITQGLGNQRVDVLLAGAIPVALLALLAEVLFSGLQRLARLSV
ncbi:MAG TPA: ABC transporter permease [Chloroflexota bacterium]|nr:ABC transporter permease [Chloroflexota bacterium]